MSIWQKLYALLEKIFLPTKALPSGPDPHEPPPPEPQVIDTRLGRPKISLQEVKAIADTNLVKDAFFLVGIRGYYSDTYGVKGANDRGYYDDAMIVVGPGVYCTFNFNTDPSRARPGHGTSDGVKGMAKLKCGVHKYRKGLHKGYNALIQFEAVTVLRDGMPGYGYKDSDGDGQVDYEQTGWFGINIHRGGRDSPLPKDRDLTSSEGCQTIRPDQYDEWLSTVYRLFDKTKQTHVKYILIERK